MGMHLSILQHSPGKYITTDLNITDVRHIQHANDSQQAFSSLSDPSLQNALPALERLHVVWKKASNKSHYTLFVPALKAGMQKLDQYYKHSAESNAHIMAMGKLTIIAWIVYSLCCGAVLNPRKKIGHFAEHWLEDLHREVKEVVQTCIS